MATWCCWHCLGHFFLHHCFLPEERKNIDKIVANRQDREFCLFLVALELVSCAPKHPQCNLCDTRGDTMTIQIKRQLPLVPLLPDRCHKFLVLWWVQRHRPLWSWRSRCFWHYHADACCCAAHLLVLSVFIYFVFHISKIAGLLRENRPKMCLCVFQCQANGRIFMKNVLIPFLWFMSPEFSPLSFSSWCFSGCCFVTQSPKSSAPGCQHTHVFLLRNWPNAQKHLISTSRDCFCFTAPFVVPVAAVLSQWTGVGGCGWPISSDVDHVSLASCAFRKRTPNLAFSVDAATSFNIVHNEHAVPFNFIACLSFGTELGKQWPLAVLLASGSFMWEASEWITNIMSNTPNLGFAFRCVTTWSDSWSHLFNSSSGQFLLLAQDPQKFCCPADLVAACLRDKNWKHWWWSNIDPKCHASCPCGVQLSHVSRSL